MVGIRLAGSVLVIVSGTLLGFWASNRMIQRTKQIRLLEKYISMLGGEIRYGHLPLPEVFLKLSRHSEPAFSTFFGKMAVRLLEHDSNSFFEAWCEEIENGFSETCFMREEKELLSRLGESLASTDCETKLSVISLFLEQLSSLCTELERENRIRTRLSRLSGILGGIFLVILLS